MAAEEHAPRTTPARTDPAPTRRRFRVVAMLLPVLVLLLLEGGLRAAGYRHPLDPPLYQFAGPVGGEWVEGDDSPMVRDPRVFWRLRPGFRLEQAGAPVNARGYRTPEVAVPKPAGVQRIVCLGDSVTFGLAVEMEQAWPARLEGHLRTAREDPRIEVVNLGVPGYSSYQAVQLLDTDVAPLQPDVIVTTFGHFNEWVPAVGRTDAEQRPAPWWRTLRVVEFGGDVAGIGPPAAPVLPHQHRLRTLETAGYTGERRVPLQAFESNLRRIADGARALGAQFVLVASPLPALTVARNPIARDYAAATRRIGAELGVPVVDGWSVFGASEFGESELFLDFCHPSRRGHDVLAQAVAAAIPPRR